MGFKLEYEESDEKINWKMTIFGIVFLIVRFFLMRQFIEDDGSFHPEVFHASYFISILTALALVLNFRVKVLNVIPVSLFPSFIFTIVMRDLPILFAPQLPNIYFDLWWWNNLTLHFPLLFVSIYIFYTKKYTISRASYIIIVPILLTWGYCLDDLKNGTLDGMAYLIIGHIILVFWTLFYYKFLMKGVDEKDPLIAPMLKVTSFKWVSKEKREK